MAALWGPLFVVAACFVLVGVYHITRECHSSWHKDGGVFYEDNGTEVIFSPNPIRIGNVLLSWKGPLWMAAGFGMVIGSLVISRRVKLTEVS
ncbi:hypothetical protein DES53_114138 [Roseimicrobium gellanilyticum]|uniref:Uncharacterized protein n=2 Tax=Roseimicrobium gellanilyticum TaxID=748857 RepID=A0A366H7W4_9BACT|nr:hypothetical protein DES53_114138 [Roseimicrobium gellanilyticum]